MTAAVSDANPFFQEFEVWMSSAMYNNDSAVHFSNEYAYA